jgi:phosphonate transport system substrate-binding protein
MMLPLTRRTCLTTLLLGAGLQTSGVHAQHKLPQLKLGIMPFNSTLALIKTHQPLVQHLEAQLGRNVVVYTSADYFTYVNELLDGHFDLAIAGPHFGAMSQARGMAILTRYKSTLQPVFVVKVGSPIQTLNDLRGKRVALSSRLSMSSIGGAKWLQDQGLKLGRDYQLVERSTHGAAVAAVAVGEVDAALTTHTPLKQIPEDVRAKIRVMPLDVHTPHLMTLAHKRLGETDIDRVRKALLHFPDTPAGRAFFKETGYEGYSEVTTADLTQLKPFVDLTVDMMRQGK